jgi:hypothetical protein
MQPYEPPTEPEIAPPGKVVGLRFAARGQAERTIDLMRRVANLIREFPGNDRIEITLELASGVRTLRSSKTIDWCPDLQRALEEMLGASAIDLRHDDSSRSIEHALSSAAGD